MNQRQSTAMLYAASTALAGRAYIRMLVGLTPASYCRRRRSSSPSSKRGRLARQRAHQTPPTPPTCSSPAPPRLVCVRLNHRVHDSNWAATNIGPGQTPRLTTPCSSRLDRCDSLPHRGLRVPGRIALRLGPMVEPPNGCWPGREPPLDHPRADLQASRAGRSRGKPLQRRSRRLCRHTRRRHTVSAGGLAGLTEHHDRIADQHIGVVHRPSGRKAAPATPRKTRTEHRSGARHRQRRCRD